MQTGGSNARKMLLHRKAICLFHGFEKYLFLTKLWSLTFFLTRFKKVFFWREFWPKISGSYGQNETSLIKNYVYLCFLNTYKTLLKTFKQIRSHCVTFKKNSHSFIFWHVFDSHHKCGKHQLDYGEGHLDRNEHLSPNHHKTRLNTFKHVFSAKARSFTNLKCPPPLKILLCTCISDKNIE